MRYLGGKYRVRGEICPYLQQACGVGQLYVEPFVGAAWVLSSVNILPAIASDTCKPLISLYRSLQEGWIPPDSISEEEYRGYKEKQDEEDPMTAFVGFGCSFGGKYFGGYARGSDGRSYARNAKNSLMKKVPHLAGVIFLHCSYDDLEPDGAMIYCDPPYSGTTGYAYAGEFDTFKFWEVMRQWSQHNTVIISEYAAPNDFTVIAKIQTETDMRASDGRRDKRSEFLFMHSGVA